MTGTDQRYDAALSELWVGLARTLTELDGTAADPEVLDQDDAVAALRRLQYSLHRARESAFGLEPPPRTAAALAELSDVLRDARDATGEVAEAAAAWGSLGAEPLLYEWRASLFRVRLARLRLAPAEPAAPVEGHTVELRIAPALLSFLLALGGAVGFVAGVTLDLWPVWTASLGAVFGAVLVYRDI